MLLFRGGNRVIRGHYWAPANGAWIDGRDEHLLPGAHDTVYLRIHPVAMFALAPAIGLAFVVALPLITVVVATTSVITRIGRELAKPVTTLAYFEWRPNEAYLAGKRRQDRQPGNSNQESE